MRQAVLAVADQADFLTALAGDQKNWELCPSFFTCGTPMANDAGSQALTGKRDFDKAKKLIAEAGYKGEKIVVLDAVDQPVAHTQALVVTDLLKKLGLNVELQAMDWGTLVTRRASKEPIDKGGWNIFATGWVGADLLDPADNLALRTNGEKGHFGWPSDDKIEALRAQWLKAATLDERKKLAAAIQERAFEVVPYHPDRAMEAGDRLSQEPEGGHPGARVPDVERRENLNGLMPCRTVRQASGRGRRR